MKIIVALILLFTDTCISKDNIWYFPDQIKQTKSTKPRISVQKCEEYKNLVLVETNIGGLSFGQTRNRFNVIKEYECNPFTGLIVGGEKTRVGEFPHMAAIGYKESDGTTKFHCGGSLISWRFVLTVAHCYQNSDNKKSSLVRLGDQNLASNDDGARPVEYQVNKFIRHPDYHHFLRQNDIALIELDRPAVFVENLIRPACLSQQENYEGSVIASGWGQTGTFKSTSDELMKVSLRIVDNNTCFTEIGGDLASNRIYPTQICAGGVRGKDTCNGDSGGPIQTSHDDATCVYDIIGVTSYGFFRCGTSTPAIYTRVYSYLDWIEKIVWNATSN